MEDRLFRVIFTLHSYREVVQSKGTSNVPNWIRDIQRVCEGIPIALCGHNSDSINPEVRGRKRSLSYACQRWENINYFDVPKYKSLTDNLGNPFLYLAQKLARDDNIHFVENHVLSLDHMSLVFQSFSMETFMGKFLWQYLHHQDDMLPVCYDFVRMTGPEWKNQLKSLDFVSDFARLASSFP